MPGSVILPWEGGAALFKGGVRVVKENVCVAFVVPKRDVCVLCLYVCKNTLGADLCAPTVPVCGGSQTPSLVGVCRDFPELYIHTYIHT